MAIYQNLQHFQQFTHSAFNELHTPGTQAPYSGIYRCEVCGHEVVSTEGNPLPPQNHNQHPKDKSILWRLLVTHTENPA
jgi:hypothetical protein